MQLLLIAAHFLYILLNYILGIIFWPYKTYFALSHEKKPSLGIFFLFLVPFYTVVATIVRNGLFHASLLFIMKLFVTQTFAIWTIFLLSFLGFLVLSELLKKHRRSLIIFNMWAFSYLPTYVWFSVTTILYFLLPPPRTQSLPGQSFSLVFIAFTIFIFLWKLLLYYLTLRVGLKMTLQQTVLASFFLFPLFGLFSLLSYKLNIFRVPFV